jgi:hypothetical protein
MRNDPRTWQDRIISRSHRQGGPMKRFWIWMIPILAAISAIWIQAALHGYDPGAVTRWSTAPLARHDPAGAPTIATVYSESAVAPPPRPAAFPH